MEAKREGLLGESPISDGIYLIINGERAGDFTAREKRRARFSVKVPSLTSLTIRPRFR